MLFRTLRASLLGNMLTGKGMLTDGYRNKEGKRILRAGYENKKQINFTSSFNKF